MSATQEKLSESLRSIDLVIAEREIAGEDVALLREERQTLLKQLAQVNATLTEGTNLLKG